MRDAHDDAPRLPAPLVWTFDGPFERCLLDLEDALRRARQPITLDALQELTPGRLQRIAGCNAQCERGQRQIDQQCDARGAADQHDRAPQCVLEVEQATLERSVEGPHQWRRQPRCVVVRAALGRGALP